MSDCLAIGDWGIVDSIGGLTIGGLTIEGLVAELWDRRVPGWVSRGIFRDALDHLLQRHPVRGQAGGAEHSIDQDTARSTFG